MKHQGQDFHEVRYWAENRINRLEFVLRILAQLDQQGWPNKSDAGWNSYDVEIFGDRWSRLQLTTVSEFFDSGKQMIRCRLRTFWSLPAYIVFWATLGCELLIIGSLWRLMPWLWLLLLTMPAIAWLIHQQERDLQRLIALLLDDVAKEFKLMKAGMPGAERKIILRHRHLACLARPLL